MGRRLTWKGIYKDFASKFPTLNKNSGEWLPYDTEKIRIHLNDDSYVIYDYHTKTVKFES